MKTWRVLALSLLALCLAAVAFADRKDVTRSFSVAPMRSVTSSVAMQQVYDTLNVVSGARLFLTHFSVTADDSAQTPKLRVRFMSSNSRTLYLQLGEEYAANQVKTTLWAPNYAFPADTSVVIQYYIVGGAPNTLDSLFSTVTYQLEDHRRF